MSSATGDPDNTSEKTTECVPCLYGHLMERASNEVGHSFHLAGEKGLTNKKTHI